MECDSRHCHFCCQRYENKMVCLWAVLCVCVWCACVCDCVRQNSLRSTYTTPTWNAILALENIRCIWVRRDNIHEPIKWSALSRQMPRSLVSTMYNTVPHIAQCSTVRDMKHKYTEVNKYYLYVSLCIIQQWKKKNDERNKKCRHKNNEMRSASSWSTHTAYFFFSCYSRLSCCCWWMHGTRTTVMTFFSVRMQGMSLALEHTHTRETIYWWQYCLSNDVSSREDSSSTTICVRDFNDDFTRMPSENDFQYAWSWSTHTHTVSWIR